MYETYKGEVIQRVKMDLDGSKDTPIQEFYNDATILVTGGTGFLGKVLIEKIMRTCPKFSRMYLIIRPKKGKDSLQRLKEIFDDQLFTKVDPSALQKISIISGDCSKPMLGLCSEDQDLLQKQVSVVFHVAATVRFDEPLPIAVAINIAATRDLMTLAKGMRKLKAFIHTSTAYSNCHLKKIEETFYNSPIPYSKLITLTECLDHAQLEQLTPILLRDVPNTYVFTKAVAEDLVLKHSKGIPVAVVRPSIIIATEKEPIPGWVDNLYGPSGVVVASTTGIMRTVNVDGNVIADVVPVDMVSNAIIASAWHLDTMKNKDSTEPPPIFNCVSSVQNPITWYTFFSLCYKYWPHTIFAIWYPFLSINSSRTRHRLLSFIWHYLPALVIDSIAQLVGKQPNLVKVSNKVEKICSLLSYFSTRQWDFRDDNLQSMWQSLSSEDQELFWFNIKSLDWEKYFYNYMRGARQYLLKDDLSSIPAAKTRVQRLYWLHCFVIMCLLFLFLNTMWYWFGGLLVSYTQDMRYHLTSSPTDTYADKINNAF
ncbi:fatty acyl-CoA reductase wat [Nilaparvata lugens]|uniref:fatty acyl-CoA reductase wat n=1 Tax=Nilaparvata lugens TaxID=108931 RepID=UPI00193E8044|nr:fatty acyl-CoA reductase wat [Nilaparvata lugens]